jgi:hypothetical protein
MTGIRKIRFINKKNILTKSVCNVLNQLQLLRIIQCFDEFSLGHFTFFRIFEY